jgi:hypothetical protein
MRSGTSPIPQFIAKLDKNKYIPATAAQLPQSEDPEAKTFLLSFKYYRDDLCEIVNLNKNGGRRGLLNMRIIGKCYDKSSLKENNIDTDFVANNGAYKTLYNGLAPDIEVLEHKIQSTARLFYFITDKFFYVRAITNTHFELDKHR